MRRILAVGILCLMGLLLLAPAHAADRIALVIGNAKYAHAPKLKNPVNDAKAIADKLKQVGFRVVMGIDLEVDDLRAKILEFSRQIEKTDVALLYYAGHAVQVDGRNLIIPVDANIKNEADLDFQAIPLNLILRQMERRNRTNLVFLDACRDNPFAKDLARSMGSRSLGLGRGLARVSSGLGTLIAFATQPGNVAYDGDPKAKHSPFTSALLEYIAIPGHDINTLLIKVRQKVIAMTNGKQVPWENSSLTGAFYFLSAQAQKAASAPQPSNPKTGSSDASAPKTSNPTKPAQPTPAPKTAAPNAIGSQIELEFWRSVRDSDDPDLIGVYLKRYPEGTFAELARLKIQKLRSKRPWSPSASNTKTVNPASDKTEAKTTSKKKSAPDNAHSRAKPKQAYAAKTPKPVPSPDASSCSSSNSLDCRIVRTCKSMNSNKFIPDESMNCSCLKDVLLSRFSDKDLDVFFTSLELGLEFQKKLKSGDPNAKAFAKRARQQLIKKVGQSKWEAVMARMNAPALNKAVDKCLSPSQ